MRIIVTLDVKGLRLPLGYHYFLQSMIYDLFRTDPCYGDFLHGNGFHTGNKRFKLFVFCPLKGKHSIEGKEIVFHDSAALELRSPDAAFVQSFVTSCRPGKTLSLQGQAVTVLNCRLENAPLLQSGVRIRTVSPITVHVTDETRHTIYYKPEEAAFYEHIVRNAERKWQSFYGNIPFDLTLIPAENAAFRRLVTVFKGTYITAWYGDFILHGSPQVLDFLYHTGLGARNSQGFGMFDLAK